MWHKFILPHFAWTIHTVVCMFFLCVDDVCTSGSNLTSLLSHPETSLRQVILWDCGRSSCLSSYWSSDFKKHCVHCWFNNHLWIPIQIYPTLYCTMLPTIASKIPLYPHSTYEYNPLYFFFWRMLEAILDRLFKNLFFF